jgi:uncharacterized protein YvpB
VSRKVLGMKAWHWLVLLLMVFANLGVVAAFAPLVFADLRAEALVQPLLIPEGANLITPTQVVNPIGNVAPTADLSAQPTLVIVNTPVLQAAASTTADPVELPAEAQITGLKGYKQSYPLSCEARSAVDWAAYFGFTLSEDEFLQRLPASDNPDIGFVGNINGVWGKVPPDSYGVHAGPVAFVLRHYGLNAHAYKGLTWDHLRAQIAQGRPVIVWVTGHVEPGTPVEYTDADGRKTTVAPFEHTVILTGYTMETVTVLDGSKVYTRSLIEFLDSWAVLGQMVITRGLIPLSN